MAEDAVTDKERIHWLFLEFMKVMARAERAEQEAAEYRAQFDYMEVKRRAKLAASGRLQHGRFRNK